MSTKKVHRTALIIDKDSQKIQFLKSILFQFNFTNIVKTDNQNDLLEYAEIKKKSYVFIEMIGDETLQILEKMRENNKSLKVVLMYDELSADQKMAAENGLVNAFVEKPFNGVTVKDALTHMQKFT